MTGDRIVVGVERSAEGAAAVETALREAVLRGVPLQAVRAWTDAVSGGYPPGVLVTSPEDAEQDARRVVEEMVKEASSHVSGADGVAVEVLALRGGAGRVLVEASAGAHLLVVGSRHAGPLSRAVLGSVSEYALHHATCPVLVVPGPVVEGDDARVLVGVDHSTSSLAALVWAADEAAARGAVLVPVLAREEDWAGDAAGRVLLWLEAAERRSLTDAVPPHEGLQVQPEVVVGTPGRALLEAARPHDLLVVGTRGRSAPVGALLGSSSSYVVRHAAGPVVVVRGR